MFYASGNFRKQLLSGTALVGLAVVMLSSSNAWAACTPAVTTGANITCTGADASGVNDNTATGVTLTVDPAATVSTAGSTVNLGSGANITVNGGTITSTGGTAVTVGGGSIALTGGAGGITSSASAQTAITSSGALSVNVGSGSTITSSAASTNRAIAYTGGSSTAVGVTVTGTIAGHASGTAIAFGNADATLTLNTGGAITGKVIAGAGTNDALILGGTSTATFNTANIGTGLQYDGFDTFTKNDSGTWTLSGSVVKNWTVNGGTLVGTTTSIGAGNISVGTGAALSASTSNNTFSGVISGAGGVTKTGASGTLTLSGTNTYTGGTTITGGTLQVANATNLGNTSGAVTLNGGGLYVSGSSQTVAHNITIGSSGGVLSGTNTTFSGNITGAGPVTLSSGGNILTGTNTFTGNITVSNSGVATIASDAKLGDSANTLTLNGGTLRANANMSTSRDIIIGASGATFDNNSFYTQTLNGVISGAGQFTMGSNGTVTLTNTNTFTGTVRINNGSVGRLVVSSDANLGNAANVLNISAGGLELSNNMSTGRAITMGSSGYLYATNGTIATISGVVSGSYLRIANGSGVVNVTGTNTYTVGTSIDQGTLAFTSDSNLGASSATVTLGNGGILRYDAAMTSARNYSFSNGTLNTNGNDVTISGVVSGTGSFSKAGAGVLTLTGTNTNSGFLYISAGTLAVNGDAAFGAGTVTPNITGGAGIRFDSAFTTARNFTTNTGNTTLDTNGNNVSITGTITNSGTLVKAGTGTLTVSGVNTYTGNTTISGGTLAASADNNLGQVTAARSITFTGGTLQYNAGFTSIRNMVMSTGGGTFNTNGNNGGVSGIISGTGNLTKAGAGTLTLSGVNTFAGTVNIDAGTLQVAADSNFGAGTNTLNFNGGTLQYTTGFSSARDVAVQSTNGTVDTNGQNATLSGVISGSGVLTKTGTGTLTLSGTNTTTGGFAINGGTLSVGSNANLGNTSAGLSFNGGTLLYTGAFNMARDIALNGNGTFNTQANASTLSGIISGTGALIKSGSGVLTLSGTNTYSGGTSIGAGSTVAITSDSNLGNTSGGITLTDGAILRTDGALTTARTIAIAGTGGIINTNGQAVTASGIISGSGGFTKSGTGTLTLSGVNTFTGGTTVTGGLLAVGLDTNLGNSANTITLNGGGLQYTAGFTSTRGVTLGASGGTVDTNGQTATLSGVVSGTGNFTKSGAGTLTLSGTNTYTGTNIVSGGSLAIAADAALGNAANTITLDGGTLQSNAAISLARNITLNTGNGTVNTNGQATTLSGVISGTGSLTKSGANTLTLSGTNTYSGGTTISAGRITVSSEANLGAVGGALTLDGGQLTYGTDFSSARNVVIGASGANIIGSTNAVLSGVISGTGNLSIGRATLSGTNTYTGTTSLSSGSVTIMSDAALGNASNSVVIGPGAFKLGASFDTARNIDSQNSAGNYVFNTNGFNSTLSGIISGERFAKDGTGTLVLTGNNTFTGYLSVGGGTLAVAGDSSMGAVGTSVNLSAAVLRTDSSFTTARNFSMSSSGVGINTNGNDITITGVISGSRLTKQGTGTLTVTGTNTHTLTNTISAGTLVVSSDANLGATSATIDIISTGTLRFDGGFDTARAISVSGGTFNTNGNNVGFSGVISGGSGFTKAGTGTLTLSGTNTFLGTVTVSGGMLALNADNNLSSGGSGLALSGGGIQFATGFTAARAVSLGAGGGVVDTNGQNATISGVISSTGTLTKIGTGTLTLTNGNTYSGQTNINGGTLAVSASGNLGNSSNGLALNGGTLQYLTGFTTSRLVSLGAGGGTFNTDSGQSATLSGVISGTGNLTKAGTGTLTLSAVNTFTGTVNVDAGTLSVAADTAFGNAANTLNFNGGTLQYTTGFSSARNVAIQSSGGTVDTNGQSATLSGVISGAGALTKIGTGTLTLSGINTYAGGTSVTGGTLSIAADNNLGNTTGALTLNASTLQFTGNANLARGVVLAGSGTTFDTNGQTTRLSGVVSGTGGFTKISSGSLALSGTNTFTGDATVNRGTLIIYTDASLGNSANNLNLGDASNTANLQFNGTFSSARNVAVGATGGTFNTNNNNITLSGVISGGGTNGINKSGGGTLTLTGTNTYTGYTDITGGTLAVGQNSALGNTSAILQIRGGATMQYTAGFSSARNIIINTGGGTIDTNGFDSTLSGVITGSSLLTKTGTGILTLGGTSTSYSGGITVTGGTVAVGAESNLGAVGGALTLNGGTLQYNTGFSSARNIAVGASGGTINTAASQTATVSGVVSGTGNVTKTGTGTLVLSGINTYTGTTTISDGVLQVGADNNLGNSANAMAIDGGTFKYSSSFDTARNITLSGTTNTIDTNDKNSTLSGIISGTGILRKTASTGGGILTLSGINTYTGDTHIFAGSIAISDDRNLGASANNLTLNGGTLRITADTTTARGITVSHASATSINNSANATLTGVISGTGAFIKTGAGTATLSGTNTYSGGTKVTGGTLNVSADNNLGNSSGAMTLDGGTLQYGADFASARALTLDAGNGTVDTNAHDATLSGNVTGAGSLTKTGTGNLTITGTNTYSGGTTISDGTITGTTTSIQGNVTNNATLAFDQTTAGTYAGVVSGTGAVTKSGTGNVTLSGTNTYSGGTTVSAGTLTGTTSSIQGNVTNDATLAFDQTTTGTYAGVVSGTGALTKSGTGNVTLSGANTYSGGTTVSGGTLTGTTTSLQSAITNNATVAINQTTTGTYAGAMSGTGALTKAGTGNVTLSGANTYSGGTTVSGGTITGTTTSIQGDVVNNAAVVVDQTTAGTYAGNMSGTGTLTKTGTGNVTLSGTNTYSGGTTISDGTITGTTTSIQGNVTNNATLAFDQTTAGTYAGVVSGTGAVTKSGTGNVTITGNNTYSGGTTVSGGTLTGTTTSLKGAITNNATVGFDQTTTGTYAGVVSGTGALTKAGTGNVTLSGTNTYSGGTTISGGTITGTTTSVQGNVVNNAAVVIDQATDGTYAGDMSGTGTLTKTDAGNLTLTGTNTYSGGTTVSGGRVTGTTTSLQGNVANNAAVTFDQTTNGTYTGNMSGTGTLTKSGTGNVTMSGTNTHTGATTINAGKLSINGTASGSAITVASGGALGGNGTTGSVIVDGTLAPGNSIDELHVNGNLTFNTGSTYAVEIDPTHGDKTTATGNINITGGVVSITGASGTYASSTNYTILQGAAVNGTFTSFMDDLAFLDSAIAYTSTEVILTMTRNDTDFAAIAKDPVQVGVATALNELGDGNQIHDLFTGYTVEEGQAALEMLSGEGLAGTANYIASTTDNVHSVVSNRIEALTNRAAPAANTNNQSPQSIEPAAGGDDTSEPEKKKYALQNRVWSEAIGSIGQSQAKDTAPKQTRGSGGIIFGFDKMLEEDGSYMGGFAGFESGHTDTPSQNATSEVDSYHIGVYGTKQVGNSWKISGGVDASVHDIKTTRYILIPGLDGAAKGNTRGASTSTFIEGAKSFKTKDDTNIEPYVNLTAGASRINGFVEKGDSGANLAVGDSTDLTLNSTLGVRADKTIVKPDGFRLTMHGNAGWQHSYGNLENKSSLRFANGNTAFDVYGTEKPADTAVMGIGMDGGYKGKVMGYVRYDGVLSPEAQDHTVTVGIKVPFPVQRSE